ncbi:adenylate/guanylate cyclase domain-containing protein [Arvimicrobium flavum]|uniref:adenylate/guanylate cyclase domain-containing protein n=1 Tax=Arvimicrobium flavum TaxID=3393320 RepID=UPI00237A1CAE|nr:adenylate/guanylate cyclase domain-containing protein [Mesorhizobium shangrilense]
MERRLSAILAADVVGYNRLMERDEVDTFERLRSHRVNLFEPEIAAHHGRIFKLTGDGLLAEFGSVVDAVECAVLLEREMSERNNGLSADRRIDVRIGLHVGDVIIDGEDRHGDAVNVAARLEQVAESGGICLSSAVLGHVRHKVALRFEPRGVVHLKNIAEPVKVFSVALEHRPAEKSIARLARAKWPVLAALMVLLASGLGYFLLQTSHESTLPVAPITGSERAQMSALLPFTQAVAPSAPASVVPPAGSVSGDQGIPVIVVLPFEDLTGDDSPGGLGKGIAEAFMSDLATFPDFEVVSSTSSFAYAGKPVPEIVKQTGALFVSGEASGGPAGKLP